MKTSTLGILATLGLFLVPGTALAQNRPINLQKNISSTIAAEETNWQLQNTKPSNIQIQLDFFGYDSIEPHTKSFEAKNQEIKAIDSDFGTSQEFYLPPTPERGYNFNY